LLLGVGMTFSAWAVHCIAEQAARRSTTTES